MSEKERQSKVPSTVDSSRFHFLTPDYDQPIYELPQDLKKRIMDKLRLEGLDSELDRFEPIDAGRPPSDVDLITRTGHTRLARRVGAVRRVLYNRGIAQAAPGSSERYVQIVGGLKRVHVLRDPEIKSLPLLSSAIVSIILVAAAGQDRERRDR